jgi:hypothetical protein
MSSVKLHHSVCAIVLDEHDRILRHRGGRRRALAAATF